MFKREAVSDAGIMARGLLILLTIVVIGVGVAEHQLAALTQRPEQERFFYIGRNREHVYSAYAFGYGLTLGKVYSLGNISLAEHDLVLKFGNHTIRVPTRVEVDGAHLWGWLDVWRRQFVAEAFAAKEKTLVYWDQAKPYLDTAYHKLRTKLEAVTKQIAEYIRE